ncbi:hypothetical protein BGX28_000743 [Mortierella sp. GBA30]|nr:hypothetical protein BGX28_000743 [Mortierella sp. GBA30]
MDTTDATASSAEVAAKQKETAQDVVDKDHDFDELVDEDWRDMDNAPRTLPLLHQPHLAGLAKDDSLVPSLASSNLEQITSTNTRIDATKSSSSPPAPLTPTISTEGIGAESLGLQGHGRILGGSSSPSSTSSESEYSLLNPSSEQSRKNSISSIAGFNALTPTTMGTPRTQTTSPTTSESHSSHDQDQDHDYQQAVAATAVTSPSFSDFVQVGSDHGDDFSGIYSGSAPSSNIATPTSGSSDEKGRPEEEHDNDNTSGTGVLLPAESTSSTADRGRNNNDAARLSSSPSPNASQESPATDPKVAVESSSTVVPPPMEAAPSSSSVSSSTASLPGVSAAKRAMYRTTVEDAESSSEEERRRAYSGARRRTINYVHEDDRDVRRSFFGAASATSTMPGAFNLGLDAELHSRTATSASTAGTASAHDPPMEERQCRICLGGADEEDTLGRLISPCLCKGSMKYVHVECLNAWRARSPKRESHYKCDTCKYSFSFRRTSFARWLAHPLTVFVLTILVFAAAVFAAGFAMKLVLYLMLDEPHDFIYPVDVDDFDADQLVKLKQQMYVFKTPDSLRAVFRIDKTHMVFGSFFVSIIGFLQLLLSTIWMGGGGGVFRIGGFGLGGRRRGARGERQVEAGIGGVLMVVILVFGLFKSVYMTYQFVNRISRRVLAKAEMMVLEVQ